MAAKDILRELYDVIQDRKVNPPEKSYVVKLLNGGMDKIAEKILEEAQELIESARETDDEHTVKEAADLIFFIMVLLGYKDIHLDRVLAELGNRFGISGIDEKESRSK